MPKRRKITGIDLFSGAGGMSLGAQWAGIDVVLAIEKDVHAAMTYKLNHKKTHVVIDDIQNVDSVPIRANVNTAKVLFGGIPCQGFSYSNQKSRNKQNKGNWLLKEFVRWASIWCPDWVIFENVSGFMGTEGGLFFEILRSSLDEKKYECSWFFANAKEFGVPQNRSRFFLIASKHGHKFAEPKATGNDITVGQALSDLPVLMNGANINYLEYGNVRPSDYALLLRKKLTGCTGHLVTKNADYIIERYKHIPQGGNWENIPKNLMTNYTDSSRCHTGIYRRLDCDKLAVTIGNYRKNMLIHPHEHRGLSVREAARLQSFPDDYIFSGSIGFQQQQVGNAVPPLLAKAIFDMITDKEI